MKTLPDNPSLEHLRRQAKDLLRGLRDTRSSATLADAQAMLAGQYGFRAWTDLKAEVDRRAGHADMAGTALAHALAAAYDLGEVAGPMRSVARPDDMGRRWWLDTHRGRWAVRTMDTWRRIVDAETDVGLQEAAARAGVLLPAPVRSRAGAIVEEIGGHRWRVYRWIPCGLPLSAPASAAATHQLGTILARIHRLALPVDRISPYHVMRPGEADWLELAAATRESRADWAPALDRAIATLIDIGEIGEGARTDRPVLCHNNLGPGNARPGPGGRLVVVGWEHAGGLPPSWELGYALMSWTLGTEANLAAARALVDGYRTVCPPPAADLAMFRGAITARQNYTFGLAQLALTATDPDERDHHQRSIRHLLGGTPTRRTLESLLQAIALSPRDG